MGFAGFQFTPTPLIDSIGLAGGLNTFNYANVNPVMNVDPTGEAAQAVPLLICGAVLVAGAVIADQIQQCQKDKNSICNKPWFSDSSDDATKVQLPSNDNSKPKVQPAPPPRTDKVCKNTLASFSPADSGGGTLTCYYQCPTKGLQSLSESIPVTPSDPISRCSYFVPESRFP